MICSAQVSLLASLRLSKVCPVILLLGREKPSASLRWKQAAGQVILSDEVVTSIWAWRGLLHESWLAFFTGASEAVQLQVAQWLSSKAAPDGVVVVCCCRCGVNATCLQCFRVGSVDSITPLGRSSTSSRSSFS
eukprot:13418121-Alexandrium_andersonii.AAC.2